MASLKVQTAHETTELLHDTRGQEIVVSDSETGEVYCAFRPNGPQWPDAVRETLKLAIDRSPFNAENR